MHKLESKVQVQDDLSKDNSTTYSKEPNREGGSIIELFPTRLELTWHHPTHFIQLPSFISEINPRNQPHGWIERLRNWRIHDANWCFIMWILHPLSFTVQGV